MVPPDAPQEDAERLLRRACAELERRLRAGEGCRAEEFFAADPALAGREEGALDLLWAEYLTRAELGQQALRDEFFARFPRWRRQLREHFHFHEWLREHAPTDSARPTTPARAAGPGGAPVRGDWPDRYEVLGEIGRGGMGVVYKARDRTLNRWVALKTLRGGDGAGPQELQRFRVEAEAAARLQHPNIVQIYEVGDHDGLPFLALEYVEGCSLEEHLGGKPQPAREAAALAEVLARAVHHAHQRGIVHRDLKPGNVLLDEAHGLQPAGFGAPKIADFGLAKLLGDGPGHTRTGAVLGTPAYMAPEQAAGRNDVGPAADVYALGAVLYEALTGRPPFQAPTSLETLEQVRSRDPVPPSRLQPGVPRDLETVCLKCLEKEPGKRYASALGLADDLRRWLDGRSVTARPVGSAGRLARWCRRRPLLAGLTAALLLTLAAGGGSTVVLWRQAEANFVAARAGEREARENYRLLMRAMQKFFRGANQDEQLRARGLEKLRLTLLKSGGQVLEEMLAKQPDDPELRAELGNLYFEAAYLARATQSREEARDLYGRAIDLFGQPADATTGAPAYRVESANCYLQRGGVYHDLRDMARSRADYDTALGLLDELLREQPDSVGHRRAKAACLHQLALSFQSGGDAARAIETYRRALSVLEGLPRDHPERDDHDSSWSKSQLNLGNLYLLAGNAGEAETSFRAAQGHFARMASKYPNEPEHRYNLLGCRVSLASALLGRGQPAEAEDLCRAALNAADELASAHPRVVWYQQAQWRARHNLGVLYHKTGRLEKAAAEYYEAVRVGKSLVENHPKIPEYQHELANTHNNLGLLHQATCAGLLAAAVGASPAYHSPGLLYEADDRFDKTVTAARDAQQLRERLDRDYPGLFTTNGTNRGGPPPR